MLLEAELASFVELPTRPVDPEGLARALEEALRGDLKEAAAMGVPPERADRLITETIRAANRLAGAIGEDRLRAWIWASDLPGPTWKRFTSVARQCWADPAILRSLVEGMLEGFALPSVRSGEISELAGAGRILEVPLAEVFRRHRVAWSLAATTAPFDSPLPFPTEGSFDELDRILELRLERVRIVGLDDDRRVALLLVAIEKTVMGEGGTTAAAFDRVLERSFREQGRAIASTPGRQTPTRWAPLEYLPSARLGRPGPGTGPEVVAQAAAVDGLEIAADAWPTVHERSRLLFSEHATGGLELYRGARLQQARRLRGRLLSAPAAELRTLIPADFASCQPSRPVHSCLDRDGPGGRQ